MTTPVHWSVVVGAIVWLAHGPAAMAQGTARSMDLDTSIRAAGMGGAGAAVWWGEPGVWGNPASLSGVQGVGWLQGKTRLAPELFPDHRLDSQRLLLGGAGIGVSIMGEPVDVGRTRLDYGLSERTDPFGNPMTFSSYEQVEGWGLGVSPLRLIEALRGARGGGEAAHMGPVEFAFGLQRKHTVVALAPLAPFGTAEEDCLDWGASARVSLFPGGSADAPLQLDISGGYAVLNANDTRFVFTSEPQAVPASRIRRMGFALHAGLPSRQDGAEPPGPWDWVLAAAPHAVELGVAFDSEHITAGDGASGYDVNRYGLEATALGMLTGRIGYVSDRLGDISDLSYGFGARLPLGPWASLAYDHASVPQSVSSAHLTRHGWSAWLDPVRIWMDQRDSQ